MACPSTPVSNPKLLIQSDEVVQLLKLDRVSADLFSGNSPGGHEPLALYATRYSGHQFGHWAGQLGDGRVLFLGDRLGSDGLKYEVQLKGAGMTPFSRRGDGRAVLRSSLREFLCSEAMHALGIPTTRALCVTLTGESVIRDLFYDGNPKPEPGAITTRVAPSFLRFGHFQMLAADRNPELMNQLVEFCRSEYFPQCPDRAAWFTEICERTARLMVEWQRVGFLHGVMNTDNMSVLGLTIDYGPYGWLEIYDPDFTPNTTDSESKRYRFSYQPGIALWNLQRFAEALSILTPKDSEWLKAGLTRFTEVYREGWFLMMSRKLGIAGSDRAVLEPWMDRLDGLLQSAEIDFPMFYRELTAIRNPHFDGHWKAVLERSHYENASKENSVSDEWEPWVQEYLQFAKADSRHWAQVEAEMNAANPYFVLRNFLVQEALDALEQGNSQVLEALWKALQTPYEVNAWTSPQYRKLPDWARSRPGCSALSCSS